LQWQQKAVARDADIVLRKGHCQAAQKCLPFKPQKLLFSRNKPISHISLLFISIGFALHDIYQILHFAPTASTYILNHFRSLSLLPAFHTAAALQKDGRPAQV
jgi:hypothetical protein